MKPKKIFLVRHGESEGNVNPSIYATVPDWKLHLTETGKTQALNAGAEIYNNLVYNNSKITLGIYSSTWERTRETTLYMYENISVMADDNNVNCDLNFYYEDPRLREQEWGNLHKPETHFNMLDARKEYSSFYYRIPDGESGADVYDRISTFLETLWRDFQSDYPENIIIVTHGFALRIFLMRWFHWSPEYFETLCNPYNCEVFILELQDNDKYNLLNVMRKKNNNSIDPFDE